MDTIAAISTPHSSGGIGVIRISGLDSHEIGDAIFKSKNGTKIADIKGYSALLGDVYDGEKKVDEAIILKFVAPKSYTGEDVLEISCHGGIFVCEKILSIILSKGARLARAGEFTKRAFENGKINLVEAEAVADIISAEGEIANRAAQTIKDGALSREIESVRDSLLSVAANMTAFVDYPDDDIPDLEPSYLGEILDSAANRLKKLLDTYDAGQIYKQGIDTVIAGRPNVGKSTLMNLLSGRDRSIVTDIAGTTRDIVEETVSLDGIKLHLYDTAGIRQTQDAIEQIGVERAKDKITCAGLILAVFDNGEELSAEDRELISGISDKPTVAIINKCDREKRLDTEYIKNHFENVIEISAVQGEGRDELIEVIKKLYGLNKLNPNEATVATLRQKNNVSLAYHSIINAKDTLQMGFTLDAVSVDIDCAVNSLFELTGERTTETVIDKVFEQFCVGK